MEKKQKSLAAPLVIALVLLIGTSIYYSYAKNNSNQFAEYTNEKYNFSFLYPRQWKVTDFKGAGPSGITITDQTSHEVMSISYNQSLEATSMQAPKGKRSTLREALSYDLSGVKEISIGGGVGYEGTFNNHAIQLSENQIWFEHQGHIYTIAFDKNENSNIDSIVRSFHWIK